MGTKLILKNADFSEHAINKERLLAEAFEPTFGTHVSRAVVNTSAPFTQVNWNLTGKIITSIKLKIATNGIITLGVIPDPPVSNPTISRSVQLNLTGEIGSVTKIQLSEPIYINSGERLSIVSSTDTGAFYFIPRGEYDDPMPTNFRFFSKSLSSNEYSTLNVEIYGHDQE